MTFRPSRKQVFMEIAHIMAKRATCFRLNVGAVITVDDRIVSTGYNGVPAGEPHCSGNDCPGKLSCRLTIHAEENAIKYLPADVIPQDLYVTHSPCEDCSIIISESGIKRIFFATPYRITDHLEILPRLGISIFQITPAGYTMDWLTKELIDEK